MNIRNILEAELSSLDDTSTANGTSDIERTKLPGFYCDPDDLYSEGAIAFIYTREHKLYHQITDHNSEPRSKGTHSDVATANTDLQTRYNYQNGEFPIVPRYAAVQAGDLAGRVKSNAGYRGKVSFWNKSKKSYERILVPCLKELLNIGIITPECTFCSPCYEEMPVAEIIQLIASTTGTAGPSSSTLEDPGEKISTAEMHAEPIHNLPPQQKKEAMRKMGLATGGKLRSKALDPGEDWWRLYSEEFCFQGDRMSKPTTRIELCFLCDSETGFAGRAEDSIYCELKSDFGTLRKEREIGPLCLECYRRLKSTGYVE